MLDIVKALTPKSKQKPPPVKEEPKPEPKKSLIPLPQSLGGKVFAGFVVLHVVFLAYFIWFMVTASITETEDEVASIMRGEVCPLNTATQIISGKYFHLKQYFWPNRENFCRKTANFHLKDQ